MRIMIEWQRIHLQTNKYVWLKIKGDRQWQWKCQFLNICQLALCWRAYARVGQCVLSYWIRRGTKSDGWDTILLQYPKISMNIMTEANLVTFKHFGIQRENEMHLLFVPIHIIYIFLKYSLSNAMSCFIRGMLGRNSTRLLV